MSSPLYVDVIQLVGCQSLANAVFKLARDKINVIRAKNNVGKSILFKMIKIAGCPWYYESDQKYLIRRGCKCATIYFQCSDGVIAACSVYPKKLVYTLIPADGTPPKVTNEPTDEFLRHTGILANPKQKFIANVIDSSQDLMLVDPKLASTVNCVKMLMYDEELEFVQEQYPELIQEFHGYVDRVNMKLQNLKFQAGLLKFIDEGSLRGRIESGRLFKGLADKSVECYEALEVIGKYAGPIINYDALLQIQDCGSFGQKAVQLLALLYFEEVPAWWSEVEQCGELGKDIVSWLSKLLYEEKQFDDAMVNCEIAEKIKQLISLLCRVYCEQRDFKPALQMCDLAEQAKQLVVAFDSVYTPVVDYEPVSMLAQVGEMAQKASSVLGELVASVANRNEAVWMLGELQHFLTENAQIVKCPIYGEVAYNGKDCVPTGR